MASIAVEIGTDDLVGQGRRITEINPFAAQDETVMALNLSAPSV
ncbi:hypothetical protein FBZ93_116175 [Bradyrhizobium macuxiense]|uniref:Uncharacterized protein n=1 Tax=Bradyrhizobium macuxiense TaxID=1755647 RepID=A0A560L1P6_9BRAD|nr:hypothetical protein [Bradyrhizobium macuxiense]TWB89456.1 hypothetical protein FBZ93_116175 [Bradyrhizobium macuxiense]